MDLGHHKTLRKTNKNDLLIVLRVLTYSKKCVVENLKRTKKLSIERDSTVILKKLVRFEFSCICQALSGRLTGSERAPLSSFITSSKRSVKICGYTDRTA